jgi:hypothetical protein
MLDIEARGVCARSSPFKCAGANAGVRDTTGSGLRDSWRLSGVRASGNFRIELWRKVIGAEWREDAASSDADADTVRWVGVGPCEPVNFSVGLKNSVMLRFFDAWAFIVRLA